MAREHYLCNLYSILAFQKIPNSQNRNNYQNRFLFFSESSHNFSPTEPGSFLIFVKLIALTFREVSTQQNEYVRKGKKLLYKKYVSKLNNFFKILNKVPVLCWL